MAVTTSAEDQPSGDEPQPPYMPPREAWTEPFWDAMMQGTLLLQRCERCDVVAYPPVDQLCTECGSHATWREASGQARLWSWTTFQREFFPGYPLSPPYTVLMLELAEGVRMLATLADDSELGVLHCDASMEFHPRELAPGMFVPGFGRAS